MINADTALHLPDFRAAERTFQLVTQVAGRTGRGPLGGRVLVQTLSPDAPAIVAALRHDLNAFARDELPHRAALGYPPLGSMVRLVIRASAARIALSLADELAQRLRASAADVTPAVRVLGPAPAPMARLQGKYRFQIQLQSAGGDVLHDVVRRATAELRAAEGATWVVDVDPLDMM